MSKFRLIRMVNHPNKGKSSWVLGHYEHGSKGLKEELLDRLENSEVYAQETLDFIFNPEVTSLELEYNSFVKVSKEEAIKEAHDKYKSELKQIEENFKEK